MPQRRPIPPLAIVRRRGEQGASLVLAMLVILVLLVVVAQVFFSSMVEVGHVVNFSEGRRFSFIAEATAAEASAALMLDLDRDEEAGGDTGGDAGGLFGGGADGLEGGEDEEEEDAPDAAQVTAETDSELDEWANIETLVPSVGEDLTILVDIVDEDSKVNLLGLFTEDEEEQERQREIMETLLTEAFLGTSYAISISDATSLVDRIESWVEGSRSGNRTNVPKPSLKPSIAEDEANASEDESVVFDDELHLPLTLSELQMLEGLSPAHLWGFIEEGEFYPGLVDYITIWSHLELKPVPEEEDEFAASPFAANQDDSEDDGVGEDGEEEVDDEDLISAQPTNDGFLNLNTVSYPVLRAVAPEDIPSAYLKRIIEFRELLLTYEDELYGEDGFFTKDENDDLDGDGFPDDDADDSLLDEDEDDEEDITRFVFSSPNEVWSKLEDEFGIEPRFDSFVQNEFERNFDVRSQVFTIKIMILESLDDDGAEQRYRRRSYRTIVWRMQTGSGVEMVTLLPVEPFWDPRRLEHLGVEMDGLSDLRGDMGGFLSGR